MAEVGPSSKCLFFFQLLILCLCKPVTSSDIPHVKDFEVVWDKESLFPSIRRALTDYFHYKMTEFDSIDPPTTALPSTPITNPVTTPTAPGIVTVPGTNPATNPVNPPVPVINPVTNPPAASGRGQNWCIAKTGASQAALQSALDYACGIGGADCATIQQGSSCYEPATLQNHASYAFNSYYQKNPVPTSCDFAGVATLTSANPSTGSCVYASSASSSTSSPTTPITQAPPTTPITQAPPTTPTTQAPPTTQTPVNPTSLPAAPVNPTTQAPVVPTSSSGSTLPGTQSPPPGFSIGNPDPTGLGAFGASPPLVNTASVMSNNEVGALVAVASIMFGLC